MANETELERLVIRLVGDVSQYTKSMTDVIQRTEETARTVERSFDQMGSAAVAQGTLVAAGIEKIVESFKEMGKESLRVFEAHETSEVKLKAVISARNGAVEETLKTYEKFADSISDVTTHGKVETEQLIQLAESYGLTGQAAEIAAKQAIGLSDTMPIAAEGAVRLTARLQQGSTEMLGRFVPGLDKVSTEMGKVALANDRFNKAFEVSKSLTGTVAGVFANLQKATHGLYSDIGELVADAVKPLIEGMTAVVKWFRSWDPIVRKVTIGVVALTAAVATFDVALTLLKGSAALASLEAVGAAILAINPEVLAIAAAVAAVGTAVTYQFGGITKTFEAVANALKPIWVGLKELGAIVAESALLLRDTLGAALKYVWSLAKEVYAVFGIDLVAAINKFIGWVKSAASSVLSFAIRVEYTIKQMRDWVNGIKGVQETFDQFKTRRLKELWGVDEAANGLNSKILPPLKEIDKLLHPREAVDYFSAEAFDRFNQQLDNVARSAQKIGNAAGGAPIFGHPVAPGSPAGGAGRNLGGGFGALPMFFGPRGGPNGRQPIDTQKEFEGLRDSAFQQIDKDPRYAGLTRAKKLEIAKNSAGREINRRHLPKTGDEMNEPSKESLRNYPESGQDFRMAPHLPSFDDSDVLRRKRGTILPSPHPQHLNNDDIFNGPEHKDLGVKPLDTTQMEDYLRQIVALLDKKKNTLEIKPLGLS